MVFVIDRAGATPTLRAPYISSGYHRERVNAYLARFQAQELADQELFARHCKPTDDVELVPDTVLYDDEEEFLARPNMQAILRGGLRYRSGTLLNKDCIDRDRFSMQFDAAHGPVSEDDARRSNLYLRHIAKALDISRPTQQLFERFQSVISCLDLLSVGVCILDGNGLIVLKNQEFQRQLETYNAYCVGPTGKLVVREAKSASAIARLLSGVEHHGHGGARPRKEAILTMLDGEDHRLCVEVAPLHAHGDIGTKPLAGYILYSLDTFRPAALKAAVMADLFGLSEAETEVLAIMAEGCTNREIAERRGKSVDTINTQAKAILAKTGTANRTQLIRLATNLSANFITAAGGTP